MNDPNEIAQIIRERDELRDENAFIKAEYRDADPSELAEDALYMANRALKFRVKSLTEMLTVARDLIAANRLVLGEYMGSQHIADVEKKIRRVLQDQTVRRDEDR